MSTLDLMEDGFPHGTREGYQKGCHSKGACMGPLDGLMTCLEANMRYSSDYGYRKRVDAGDSAEAIAESDRAAAAAPKAASPKPKPAGVTVEQSVEPLRERVVPAAVEPEPIEVPEPVSPSSSPSNPEESEPSGKFMSDDEVATMLQLHSDGLSDGAIARELGRAQANVSRQLRKRGLASNGRATRTTAEAPEPPAAVQEHAQEVRADGILADLAEARSDAEGLRVAVDGLTADLAIERQANEPLKRRMALLEGQLSAENELRTTAEKRVAVLTDQVATLGLELDVAKSPDAAPAAALVTVPVAPVAAVEDPAPARAGSVGLDIQQVGDALSVRLHGGEPVHLNLQFNGGALSDVGVKIGA